jgi:hypothetical protein
VYERESLNGDLRFGNWSHYWVVYKKLGLAVLRQSWINFDLIWAVALLVVGGIALFRVTWGG